nr:acyltransferase family protein [Saccharofermentans sp.]
LMCIGHDHLDFTGKTPEKLSKMSYLFYIVHFPVVVLSQYFLNLTGMDVLLNFFLTVVIAYLLTYFICVFFENVRR